MNERKEVLNVMLVNPTEGGAAPAMYFEALTDMTIVGVSAVPHTTDTATIDISDDGTDVIAAIAVSATNVPGTWQAKGYGGTNAPVVIAKDSLVGVNANDAANGTAFSVIIHYLAGEDWK